MHMDCVRGPPRVGELIDNQETRARSESCVQYCHTIPPTDKLVGAERANVDRCVAIRSAKTALILDFFLLCDKHRIRCNDERRGFTATVHRPTRHSSRWGFGSANASCRHTWCPDCAVPATPRLPVQAPRPRNTTRRPPADEQRSRWARDGRWRVRTHGRLRARCALGRFRG